MAPAEVTPSDPISARLGKAIQSFAILLRVRKSCLKRFWLISVAFPVLFACISSQPARAGNMDGVIDREYPSRLLMLRHFYSGDRLRFRSDGSLVGDRPAGTLSVNGLVEVRDASLDRDVLTIKCRRIYQVYDAKSRRLVDALTTIESFPQKQRGDIEKVLRKDQVRIEIEMPPAPDPREIPETLHAVFVAPGESMSGVVPPYWQAFFDRLDGRPEKASDAIPSSDLKKRGISFPRATYHPDPEFTDVAREMKYQGNLVITLVVDPTGTPRDLQIARPLGLGLDEKAIETVGQWKFQPAEKDGQPVPVSIAVEVNFRLY